MHAYFVGDVFMLPEWSSLVVALLFVWPVLFGWPAVGF